MVCLPLLKKPLLRINRELNLAFLERVDLELRAHLQGVVVLEIFEKEDAMMVIRDSNSLLQYALTVFFVFSS